MDYEIGSKKKTMGGYSITLKPGLYLYSGFGVGTYYSVDGRCYSQNNTREVRDRANNEGVKFVFRDTFDGYQATYLGD